MSALFADTFYWIALTNVQDLAHEKVKAFSRAAKPNVIWTTETGSSPSTFGPEQPA
jgi:hypothetical protein